MIRTVRRIGGSPESNGGEETRAARAVTVRAFCRALRAANHNTASIRQVKTGAVLKFVAAMKADELSVRTMQNRIAHLRVLVPDALRGFTNKRLGISGSCRDGTKRAITNPEFRERLAKVRDPGCRAALMLQRALGLRAQESVRAAASLRDWQRRLNAGEPLRVIYGTKGKRGREVWPPDRELARRAIAAALEVSRRQGGQIVVGQAGTLKSAMDRLENAARRAGFTGEISMHSNRYSFTHDRLAAYAADAYDKRNAAAMTSQDLGHGDSRARYIGQVYGRGADVPTGS